MMADIRRMSCEVQVIAPEKGLIAYIPADRKTSGVTEEYSW